MPGKRIPDGTVINGVTLLKTVRNDTTSNYRALCRCHCGKEFTMWKNEFIRVKSCGCLRRRPQSDNWIGKQIAQLQIVAKENDNEYPPKFIVRCKHGHDTVMKFHKIPKRGKCAKCVEILKNSDEFHGVKGKTRFEIVKRLRQEGYNSVEIGKAFKVSSACIKLFWNKEVYTGEDSDLVKSKRDNLRNRIKQAHNELFSKNGKPPSLVLIQTMVGSSLSTINKLRSELYRSNLISNKEVSCG